MCPKASMMPSLASTRLATASSRRRSANGSAMGGFLCFDQCRLVFANPSVVMPGLVLGIPLRGHGAILSAMAGTSQDKPGHDQWRELRAADAAKHVCKLIPDFLRQLGAGARDARKLLEPLERPAGVDD